MALTVKEINDHSHYVRELYRRRDSDPAARLAADLLDRLAMKGDGEPFCAMAYEGTCMAQSKFLDSLVMQSSHHDPQLNFRHLLD